MRLDGFDRNGSTPRGSAPLGRWRRVAAAALVAAGAAAPLLAAGPSRAQESGALSLAAITPADVAVYAEIDLDPGREQLQLLDDLLLRLGNEDSLIEALADSDATGTGDIDLEGAEAAIAVLPSALEAQENTDVVSDGLSGDTDAVAEGLSEATENAQGLVVLIKPTDLDAAVESLEEELAEQAGGEAGIESETVEGVEIRSVPADGGADAQAYAVIDDTIVFGAIAEDVAEFAGVSADDSLAGSESFSTAVDLLPAERVALAFVNGQAFLDAVAASDDPDAALAADLVEQLGNLNVDQGLALVAEEAGLRTVTVQVPRDGSADAEASGTAADLLGADRVPADTLLFVNGFNLGRSALLEGVALLLVGAVAGTTSDDALPIDATPDAEPVASPVADDVDALYEAAAETIGVNFKTEFLDTLTGDYTFALWGVDAEDPTEIAAILASDVGDVEALDGTLSFINLFVQAGAQGQASVTTRTVGDSEISNVTLGDPAAPISIDYGIVEEELLIGVGDGVDVYLEGPDATLADDDAYQETLGYLPAEHDGVFYADLAAVNELSTELEGATAGLSTDDASPECEAYDSQDEAQAAYDEDPTTNFELDLDFDGEACEDFFSAADASPEASPVAGSDVRVGSLAMVSYADEGYAFTESFLVVEE